MNKFREQILHDPNSALTSSSFQEGQQLFITRSTTISGVLNSENDITLDGNFNGVLYSKKTVYITKTGVVKGVIICNDLKVEGELEGSVFSLKVNLCRDSIVNGSIHCTIINTEMNQFVDANIKLLSLENTVFESSSAELFHQLHEVFNTNNKENNYLAIFQKKLDEIKPSTKFYHSNKSSIMISNEPLDDEDLMPGNNNGNSLN